MVMTLEQPLDKRLFDSKYDDVEILGKLVTRGGDWQPIGFALHVQNGTILGAAYARLKPSLPGPAVLRGLAGLIEHVSTWPMVALVDRYYPARKELDQLVGPVARVRYEQSEALLLLLREKEQTRLYATGPHLEACQPWAWSTILINFPELRIPS